MLMGENKQQDETLPVKQEYTFRRLRTTLTGARTAFDFTLVES
jgi:hypothetical protein